MTALFLACAAFGGVLLLAQLALGAVGADHHDVGHADTGDHHHHGAPGDGLQLFSVRALSAGVAFFGLGGLGAGALGWPLLLALPVALVLGLTAMVSVALAMRAMLGFERDATVRIGSAVGEPATVYVPVPAALGGLGKVVLTLHGRTVEYQAVTPEEAPLATGTPVIVVDVRDDDTLEVVSLPSVDGVL